MLDEFGVELIGASVEAIHTAEDRSRVQGRDDRDRARGAAVGPRVHARRGDRRSPSEVGYPLICGRRSSSAAAAPASRTTPTSCATSPTRGLAASPVAEILIEQSVRRVEGVRARGDARPRRQRRRRSARSRTSTRWACTPATRSPSRPRRRSPTSSTSACATPRSRASAASASTPAARTSSSALNPENGEMVVIEMNPRVSRSSALASKATGFPIAKIAAQARGRVPARRGHATTSPARRRRASSRPSTTSSPRSRAGRSRSCPGATPVLGTLMQSVGEVMAIGRTFPESLQKALRSLETGRRGLNCDPGRARARRHRRPTSSCAPRRAPTPERLFLVEAALRRGRRRSSACTRPPASTRGSSTRSLQIVEARTRLAAIVGPDALDPRATGGARSGSGFADAQLAYLWGVDRRGGARPRGSRPASRHLQDRRHLRGGVRGRARRTTTAPTRTRTRSRRSTRPAVVILGSGPNRIGQGVEFDYCCVHAAFALSDAGFETVMVNCNPETVSTDYDTSDRLFFEPLTDRRTCCNVCDALHERADGGELAGRDRGARRADAAEARAHARGTPASRCSARAPTSIDLAEDREQFNALCERLGIPQPPGGTATDAERRGRDRDRARLSRCWCARRTCSAAARCRSSTTTTSLDAAMAELAADGIARARRRAVGRAARRSSTGSSRTRSRSTSTRSATRTGEVLIGGVMEHIEEAGVHSGDSACAIPPPTLTAGDRRDDRGAHRARSPTRSTSAACSTCSTR